jgi:glutathione synthase
MDFAFIVDPLPQLKAYKDSSIAMMRALSARGHAVYALGQSDVWWEDSRTKARATRLDLTDDNHHWYTAGEPEERALKDFAAVLMRKDPPFDMEYVYSTYLLEAAEREGARVFNRPRASGQQREDGDREVRRLHHADDRHAGRRPHRLVHRRARDVIVKPLDGMGGASIFRVREDDPNRNVIVETVSQHGARTVMAQRFIPEIVTATSASC